MNARSTSDGKLARGERIEYSHEIIPGKPQHCPMIHYKLKDIC